jgi:hypothetical protein
MLEERGLAFGLPEMAGNVYDRPIEDKGPSCSNRNCKAMYRLAVRASAYTKRVSTAQRGCKLSYARILLSTSLRYDE